MAIFPQGYTQTAAAPAGPVVGGPDPHSRHLFAQPLGSVHSLRERMERPFSVRGAGSRQPEAVVRRELAQLIQGQGGRTAVERFLRGVADTHSAEGDAVFVVQSPGKNRDVTRHSDPAFREIPWIVQNREESFSSL